MSTGVVASFPRAVASGLSEPTKSLNGVVRILQALEDTAKRVSSSRLMFPTRAGFT